jgi:hypothetical protein
MMLQCAQLNSRPYQNERISSEASKVSKPTKVEPWCFDFKTLMHVESSQVIFLEPTPIAPTRMNIVDQFDVEESLLLHEDSIYAYLRPLLNQRGPDDLKKLSKHTSEMSTHNDVPLELVSSEDLSNNEDPGLTRFRESHLEKWGQRFQEIIDFRDEFGHCLVPLEWPHNTSLAHWVKRQRCQYKARSEGKHSTLTYERQVALEELGFVWDSHRATWGERLNEITAFCEKHGHCNVPSKYPQNPQLSIWVKCQRRQFKLYLEKKKSNMTRERISKLSSIGFVWTPRQRTPIAVQQMGLLEQLFGHC